MGLGLGRGHVADDVDVVVSDGVGGRVHYAVVVAVGVEFGEGAEVVGPDGVVGGVHQAVAVVVAGRGEFADEVFEERDAEVGAELMVVLQRAVEAKFGFKRDVHFSPEERLAEVSAGPAGAGRIHFDDVGLQLVHERAPPVGLVVALVDLDKPEVVAEGGDGGVEVDEGVDAAGRGVDVGDHGFAVDLDIFVADPQRRVPKAIGVLVGILDGGPAVTREATVGVHGGVGVKLGGVAQRRGPRVVGDQPIDHALVGVGAQHLAGVHAGGDDDLAFGFGGAVGVGVGDAVGVDVTGGDGSAQVVDAAGRLADDALEPRPAIDGTIGGRRPRALLN